MLLAARVIREQGGCDRIFPVPPFGTVVVVAYAFTCSIDRLSRDNGRSLTRPLRQFIGLRGIFVYSGHLVVDAVDGTIRSSDIIEAMRGVGLDLTAGTGPGPTTQPIYQRTWSRAPDGATRGHSLIEPSERMPADYVIQSTDATSARVEFGTVLHDALAPAAARRTVRLVRSDEGIGKSTAMLAQLDEMYRTRLSVMNSTDRDSARSRPTFFFAHSYKSALEKYEQYRDHGDGRFAPIYLPSLTHTYQQVCARLGRTPLTLRTAAEDDAGYKSWLDAVKNSDPEVWDSMRADHAAAWVGDRMMSPWGMRRPLIFSVHATAHTDSLVTGWWYTPHFFELDNYWDVPPQPLQIVYDEVTTDTFVRIDRGNLVDLAHTQLFSDAPELWATGKLSSKYKHWLRRNQWTPGITFELALELHARGYTEADRIQLKADCEEQYGRPGGRMYCAVHAYYAKPNRWRDHYPEASITMLTTESVPTQIARAISDVQVIDIASNVRRGILTVCSKKVYSQGITREIEELRRNHGDDLRVISNRADHLPGTITHAAARGRNDMTDRMLAQIVPCMHPDQVDICRVINNRFGIENTVAHTHMDEIQQSAGRNLGFRHDGEAEHIAVVNESVWKQIADRTGWRYHIEVRATATQRKNKKYDAKRERKAVDGVEQDEWVEVKKRLDAAKAKNKEPDQVESAPEVQITGKPRPVPAGLPESSDAYPIKVTLFDGLLPRESNAFNVKFGERHTLTWAEWKSSLDEAAQTRWGPDKADAPAVCAAWFREDRRLKDNIEASTMVLIDFDGGVALNEVQMALNSLHLRYSIWTTASHHSDLHKFRVAAPFSHSLTAQQHRWAWFALSALLPGAPDGSKIGAESGFYLPGRYSEYDELIHHEGEVCSLAWLYEQVDSDGIDVLAAPKPAFVPVVRSAFLERMIDARTKRKQCMLGEPGIDFDPHATTPERNALLTQRMLDTYFAKSHGDWHRTRYGLLCSVASRARKNGFPLIASDLYQLYMNIDGALHYKTTADQKALRRDCEKAIRGARG